uniref:Potassium calcium-activated channel subfamily M regulatory beta subunit 3 n=1 Tax=Mastacembelus armatus TaxID=205130 RepID=A0A7N8YAK5_9TELE
VFLWRNGWRGGMDGHGEQRARTQMPASSLGEDRAILLGFAMIAFSGLMFFVVGVTMVKPYVNSNWEKEEAGCVLMQADILKDWVDCRGVSIVPCLRVTVNLTGFNQSAFLHFDEESVLLTSEVGIYGRKFQLKMTLDTQMGSSSSCFTDRMRHPKDVILNRKYTLRKALLALLWPCVMLGGGALLVAFVKLTQCLAILSSEILIFFSFLFIDYQSLFIYFI